MNTLYYLGVAILYLQLFSMLPSICIIVKPIAKSKKIIVHLIAIIACIIGLIVCSITGLLFPSIIFMVTYAVGASVGFVRSKRKK